MTSALSESTRCAGIHPAQGPLELLVGFSDRVKDLGVGGEGLLEGGRDILQQHGGRAHIHHQKRMGRL